MNEDKVPRLVGGIGKINFGKQYRQGNRIYDANEIAMAITAQPLGNAGGNSYLYLVEDNMIENPISTNGTDVAGCIRATYYKNGERNIIKNITDKRGYEGVIEPMMCASRGRNPENPTSRIAGLPTEQRLEISKDPDVCNCLTSAQKDSLVLEKDTKIGIKQATKQGYIECEVGGVADFSYPNSQNRRGRVQENGQVSPTITTSSEVCKIEKIGQVYNDGSQCGAVVGEEGLSATISAGTHGYCNSHIQNGYRIRKLTPKECWRLMNFSDEDYEKAAEVNSSTQLYKQAGNAIVKNVLVAIFGQMFEGKEDIYKEVDLPWQSK